MNDFDFKELNDHLMHPENLVRRESKQARRVRLIEQYAGMMINKDYGLDIEKLILEATMLADAVIEATKEGE